MTIQYGCFWLYLCLLCVCVPVQAKTDKITALEKYRERSQPCFLFLAVSLAALWGQNYCPKASNYNLRTYVRMCIRGSYLYVYAH